MSDVKWIKIETGVFNDEKILMIESLPAADSVIVIWFKLLILAGRQNNDGVFIMNNRIPYTDEMLASIFRRDLNTVKLALATFQNYGMIEIVEDVITIPNWSKYQTLDAYERKKERDRIYQAERRANQKLLIQKSAEDSIVPDNKEIETFYESVWALYPIKKGKGQVSLTQKKKLFNIGYDELKRCIDRFVSDMKNTDRKYWMHGSTFFNSGYVDYLDENYLKNTESIPVGRIVEDEPVIDLWSED